MSMNTYYELREMHGSAVVWWQQGEGYSFCMGDDLMNDEQASFDFEEYCEGDDNIHIYIGHGDDVMNCVEVKDMSKLDEHHIEFLEEYVGSNCYTRGG